MKRKNRHMTTQATQLAIKELTPAQQRQFQRHIKRMDRADWEIEKAQSARSDAEQDALEFLGYALDELGLKTADGWQWSADQSRFVQLPVSPPPNGDGEGKTE